MHNKKGSISILVMCLGSVILFAGLLFMLHASSVRVSSGFGDVFSYGEVYVNQSSLENSLYFILVESFLNNYQLVLRDNSEKIGYENINLNDEFARKMGAEISGLRSTEDQSEFGELLRNRGLLSKANRESSTLFLNENWNASKIINDSDGNVNLKVNYSSFLNVTVSFDMLELPSFDDINKIYCACLASADLNLVKKCFSARFSNFDVNFENPIVSSLSQSSDMSDPNMSVKTIVKLKSRDEYYISKKMDNIAFNLVFDYSTNDKSSANLVFCSAK